MVQMGKYKTAVETFTRKDMSDANREYINSLLDDLFNRYVDAIAKARNKSADEVRALIDDAPYSAAKAKELGLIDGVAYHDEIEKELKTKLGYKESDELHMVPGSAYSDVEPESLGLNKGERIAVIYAAGDIGSGKSNDGATGSESIGSDTLAKAINDAGDDKSIKAIVIRVDSPGGSGLASDIIWHAVEAAKAKKPVVISMSDVAASGGYYIAAGANKIIAQPSTITGSINRARPCSKRTATSFSAQPIASASLLRVETSAPASCHFGYSFRFSKITACEDCASSAETSRRSTGFFARTTSPAASSSRRKSRKLSFMRVLVFRIAMTRSYRPTSTAQKA